MGQKRNLKEQFKKYIELKQNENRTYQNLWDADNTKLKKIHSIRCHFKNEDLKS